MYTGTKELLGQCIILGSNERFIEGIAVGKLVGVAVGTTVGYTLNKSK